MAGETIQPTSTPAAPSTTDTVQPGSTPDLSALTASGPQAQPNLAATVSGAMAPYQANEQAAAQKAADLANAPAAVPVAGPHARLLAMVQGLALGADAFGKSIATHGREGGVQEVQQVQQAEQQSKIQAQQAALAQKNAQIQQQLTVADTNHKIGQNILFMATLPNELAQSDLKVRAQQQGLEAGAAQLASTKAEFQSQYGVTPDQYNQIQTAGAAGTSGALDPKVQQNLMDYTKQKLGAAAQILPADDPTIAKAQQVVADPKSTPNDILSATAAVNRQVALNKQVQASKEAQETADKNSKVGMLSTPQALADPGAQASINAAISDSKTSPADKVRLQALLPMADAAQKNALAIDTQKKSAEQAIQQGDPDAAGKMLADRTLTLSELKARSVTPAFIEKAVMAAQKVDPTFKAPEAEAQAKLAANPANAAFFGNTDSMLVKGGTLDQLKQAHDALGNGAIPAFNSVKNAEEAAAGSGPVAKYAATLLGLADDYSKVMSGSGSDTSREQALKIISKNLSDEGFDGATSAIRGTVTSQRNGRIGQNPYLKAQYPDPSTVAETPGKSGTNLIQPPPAAAKGQAKGTDGLWYYHDAQGNNIGLVPGQGK